MRHRQRILLIIVGIIGTAFGAGCGSADPALLPPSPDTVSVTDAEPSRGAAPRGNILFVASGNIYRWRDGDIMQVIGDDDLDDGVDALSPDWSPTGDRFAYVEMHRDEAYSDLIVANAEGRQIEQLTTNRPEAIPGSLEFAHFAYWALDPAWSPDSDEIVFASDRGGWEMPFSPDPNDPKRLSDPMFLWFVEDWDIDPYILSASEEIDLAQEAPSFSPGGSQVAVVVRQEISGTVRPPAIWTLDLDTGDVAELVTNADAYESAWSPDGDSVAYIQRSADGASNDVWIAPVDGSAPYRLTTIGSCVSPTWSPDGSHLAFFRLNDDGNAFEAWSVEVAAGANGRLTAGDPEQLFTPDDLDPTSGMSWAE